jgi:hypothetical protein
MNNKEKFEGKILTIYAPNKSRLIDELLVQEVINDDVLYGESVINGIETAYYLSDGIFVKIKEA